MRAGGVAATFTQQVDAAAGRIDIAIVRPGDATGVAGTGLLGAVLFDAVGGGPANLSITGAASGAARHARPAAVRHGACGDGQVMMRSHERRGQRPAAARGYTFVELIVVTTILMILASAVLPLAQVTSQRQKEAELRRSLREMRTAHRPVQGRRRRGTDSDDRARAGQRGISPGSRDARRGRQRRRRRQRPEAEVPAAGPDRSDDERHRVGDALVPGHPDVDVVGRAERVRRVHEERRDRPGRDEVQRLVNMVAVGAATVRACDGARRRDSRSSS